MNEPQPQHPTAVYIERKPVRRDRFWTPAFSRRLPVVVEAETAPTPVQYTAFAGVGRDITHARPHMWRYQNLSIADKLSIAAQHFGVIKTPGAMVVPGSTVGGMNPVQERTGIIPPPTGSLAARAAVYADPVYAPYLAKLL